MVSQFSLIVFCLAQLSTAIRIQGRDDANSTAIWYSNSTLKTKSLSPIAAIAAQTHSNTPPTYYSRQTSGIEFSSGLVEPRPSNVVPAPNESDHQDDTATRNASCTIQIPDASIEWWFPATYSHPLATITSRYGNYSYMTSMTFVPHTTPFDVAGAIESQTVCTSGWTTDTVWDYTHYTCVPYTVRPTAASTAVVYRTAIPPIPTPAEIDISELRFYDIPLYDLPSMTTAISIAPNRTAVETMPTPFVRFTAYEIERGNSTETVQLSSVYIQSYELEDTELQITATGGIPGDFMNQLPQSACKVGVLQAVITVIIFVDTYYYNRPDLGGIVHWESTALGWEDAPSPAGLMKSTAVQLQILSDWNLSFTSTNSILTGGRSSVPTIQPGPASDLSKDTQVPQYQTVGTVGTAPVVVGPSSVVVIGTQTLKPGGSAVLVGGTPVVLVPSATAIVVGGTSLPLPQKVEPESQQTIGTLGTAPVVIGPSSVVVIGTQTLHQGGPPATLGPGRVVSLDPSGTALIVAGTTSFLPQAFTPAPHAAAPPVLIVGSTTIIPNAATQFFVETGQTLTPGGTAVIDGIRVSLDTSAAFVVLGGSTQVLPSAGVASVQRMNAQPEMIFGGATFTALPASSKLGSPPSDRLDTDKEKSSGPTFIISGQTLAPGAPPITVSGSTLSLAPSGSFLVIDGYTTTLATPVAAAVAAHVTPPPLTIGNGIFRPLPGTGTTYQIGTALLTPGGSIVVAGTTISLAVGATALIINGISTILTGQTQAVITNPPVLTIGSQTYSAAPGTGTTFVIGGQTLTPGGTITVDGTTIVLSPLATELVYGSSESSTSTTLFPATTTSGSITSSTASASQGQSGVGLAVSTSLRQGAAPAVRLPFVRLLKAMGCVGWLLV